MTKSGSTTYQSLAEEYQATHRAHWDSVFLRARSHKGLGRYYHQRLRDVFAFLVPPGRRILEIGSGSGDLLAGLAPALGVGIDFSCEAIKQAHIGHPECHFILADGHTLPLKGDFDVIILSDLLNDVFDVQSLLSEVRRLCHPGTRILINNYSRVWQLPLWLAEKTGAAKQNLLQNWLTPEDIRNILHLAGMEVIRHWLEIILPVDIPFLTAFSNKFLARIWPFCLLGLTNCYLTRPLADATPIKQQSTSILIPARNEAGNIPEVFKRLASANQTTELIFVEGHSTDDTWKVIQREVKKHPEFRCKVIQQIGIGKAEAVRAGFEQASGDILMILDGDLTVPPEYLERFRQALVKREGEFINGVRLVYPLPRESMQFLNFLGNKFFSLAFTWLLGQPIKDTLCGTKVLFRKDYERIAANRSYFGDFDPFGDFDLLFGAARLGLKIVDIPIRYQERTYGSTNISRYRHGALLLRMVIFAARRLKFI
ncbi:MAG: glycosyltransferase [Anaerolineaceae bacterium]|nr:glycosyltransferase [Anaerolineaceae bacterium]